MANVINVPAEQPTITAAIAAAATFDTIRVAPGVYNETVIINKTIQLLGAQADVNAVDRGVLSQESIISTNNISGAVQIQADNVVVDGFTIEFNTVGPGIFSFQGFSGFWIQNNIVRNNSYGIYVNSNGLTTTQVKQNYLFNNNIFGNAVYSDQGASNIFIENNYFAGQHNSASINFTGPLGTQENIIISNNTFFQDNSIALTNTVNVKITGNTITRTQGSSIFFGGGTDRTEIENNVINTSISNGIRVTTVFSGTPNANIRAKNNSIEGNAVAGLNLDAGAYVVAPRLLDATNNWWGSATGPNPPGTGDAVIDPDGVAVVQPFLTSNPFPSPEVSVNYSTGPLLIEGSTTETMQVTLLNNDPTNIALVEILGFFLITGIPKTANIHELFALNPNETTTRTYQANFPFAPSIELQFGITNSQNLEISCWGTDASNNLTDVHRLVSEELITIPQLTPNVP